MALPPRDRHLRHAQRPASYAVAVLVAFTAAGVGAFALWQAEARPAAAVR